MQATTLRNYVLHKEEKRQKTLSPAVLVFPPCLSTALNPNPKLGHQDADDLVVVGLIVPRIRCRMGVLEQALLLLPTSLWMAAYTRVLVILHAKSEPASQRERERASRSVYCAAVILPRMAVWWIASKSCTALHPHHESHSMARRSSPGLWWRPQAWGKLEVSLSADALVASNSWRICCRTRTTNYLWFLCTRPEGTAQSRKVHEDLRIFQFASRIEKVRRERDWGFPTLQHVYCSIPHSLLWCGVAIDFGASICCIQDKQQTKDSFGFLLIRCFSVAGRQVQKG